MVTSFLMQIYNYYRYSLILKYFCKYVILPENMFIGLLQFTITKNNSPRYMCIPYALSHSMNTPYGSSMAALFKMLSLLHPAFNL